jgi:hypothetical protein
MCSAGAASSADDGADAAADRPAKEQVRKVLPLPTLLCPPWYCAVHERIVDKRGISCYVCAAADELLLPTVE